jgi:hypothetical protein
MIIVALAATLDAAGPIEPVLSARNTMSGFGGIAGVCTVFVIVTLVPESSVAVYELGSTPEPDAADAPNTNTNTNINNDAATTATPANLRLTTNTPPKETAVINTNRRSLAPHPGRQHNPSTKPSAVLTTPEKMIRRLLWSEGGRLAPDKTYRFPTRVDPNASGPDPASRLPSIHRQKTVMGMDWNKTTYRVDSYDTISGNWLTIVENETDRDEAERHFGHLAAQGFRVRLITVSEQYANPGDENAVRGVRRRHLYEVTSD